MKFTCNTLELSEACQNVQRAASTKSTIPSIEGILLRTDGFTLVLTGYDLEMGITTSIPCHTEEEGSIVLNAHMLSDILRRLPGETVIIEANACYNAQIKSGEAKYNLNGFSPDDYPELPSVSNGYPVTLEQSLLKDMVRKTIFSVATKGNRVVHTGVKFEISENHIRLIAVDGVRLALRNETIKYEAEPLSFVVPAKTLSEVVKLMSEENGEVSIGVGKRHIIFELEGYCIISRLLDGEFLDYKSAIPSITKTIVTINTRNLIDSIERTSLIITDKLKSPVKCSFRGELVDITSVTSSGTASDRIIAKIEGEDCIIGFNNKYMTDALRVCDTDEVKVKLNGPLSPILIVPTEGESFIFLILPVRLKNED